MELPEDMRWLFWVVDFDALRVERDASSIIPRVLELGRLVDVQWLLATYEPERIRSFLRDVGHPESAVLRCTLIQATLLSSARCRCNVSHSSPDLRNRRTGVHYYHPTFLQ